MTKLTILSPIPATGISSMVAASIEVVDLPYIGLFFIDAFSFGGHGKEITGSESTEKTWEQSPTVTKLQLGGPEFLYLKHLQNYG